MFFAYVPMSESRLCLLYRGSEFTSVNVSWVARDNVPCRESEGRARGRVWDRVPAGAGAEPMQ